MPIETLKGNSKQKTEKNTRPFTSLPTKFKTRFYGPASLTDIIYCSFQAKFSRLVPKFSNVNVLFTCVIKSIKRQFTKQS